MAEYWKSAPRFWCKQCKVFIRDTAFEKTQHEASAKHQGNLKRFLRDIHRGNERQQRESQRAKDEVERLRQTVAGTAADKDGNAAPWKRTSAVPPPAPRPISLEERKKQMAQLAEMGVAIPDEFRGDMALAGEWQTLSEKVIETDEDGKSSSAKTMGVRKRKHEGDDDEDEGQIAERVVSQAWGSRTRSYPGAQDEGDEDLDALLASTKDIKKVKTSAEEAVGDDRAKDMDVPIKPESDATAAGPGELSAVKTEEPSEDAAGAIPAVKADPEEAAPGVVFKKRKPKAMRK